MSRFFSTLLLLALSIAAGYVLFVIYSCLSSWYRGGSADPHCAMGSHGYVETHHLDEGDRVSCDYRPDITDAPR